MKTKLLIAATVALAMFAAAFLGYFAGHARAAVKWGWVPKEHNLLFGSMQRIEVLLSQGDTGKVVRAIAAYNQTVTGSTNEFDFFRAADALWEHTKQKP